jgi:hypothetical protein
LTLAEVSQLKTDFINAAISTKHCGRAGAGVHRAHDSILTQFLSSDINKRTNDYSDALIIVVHLKIIQNYAHQLLIKSENNVTTAF